MNILLKSATIIDETSTHHLKRRDVLIKNGTIKKIKSTITNTEQIKEINVKNLYISQGWFDSSVSFGEPGFEERETISNGLLTAAYSGFTHVAINANVNPVTDSKSTINYIKTEGDKNIVTLYPVGALTTKGKGEDLAELYDMKNEGAICFYDYKRPITNPNLLKIALQYSQSFDGIVQSFPFEKAIAHFGMVHEDKNSTRLGLKGIPAFAEELQIARDLSILEYTGGKLHIPTISTKKSVSLIKEAKKKGLQVTCSVAISNLILTDEVLETFDTNYKLLPPLRTKTDIKALLKGIKEGVIDGVTSDHNPIDIENKKTEFDHALYGSIGLESCFGALNTVLDIENSIMALSGLKKTFGIPQQPIEEGNLADLSLFNPFENWIFSKNDITSTSQNAALLGVKLKGKVYGIIANNKIKVIS